MNPELIALYRRQLADLAEAHPEPRDAFVQAAIDRLMAQVAAAAPEAAQDATAIAAASLDDLEHLYARIRELEAANAAAAAAAVELRTQLEAAEAERATLAARLAAVAEAAAAASPPVAA